jgi:hypothetical protein
MLERMNPTQLIISGKVSAYMKAAYSLRRGFKEFEGVLHTINTHAKGALLQHLRECDATNAHEPTLLHVNQTELQSVYHGAQIGLNICVFMISLLPPRAKALVALVGIKGNRYDALDALREGAGSGSYKAAIAGFVLALCLSELLKYVEARIPHRVVVETARVLDKCIDNFPDSHLFLMMRAKNLRARGLYKPAIDELVPVVRTSARRRPPRGSEEGESESGRGKDHDDEDKDKEEEGGSSRTSAAQSVHNACRWELCSVYLAAGNFGEALRNIAPMLKTTKRLQNLAFYTFLISFVVYELDYEDALVLAAPPPQQQHQHAPASASTAGTGTPGTATPTSAVQLDLDVVEALQHARDRIDSQPKKDAFNQMMLRRVQCLIEARTVQGSEAQAADAQVPYAPVYEILYYWNEIHETSEELASRILRRLEGDDGATVGAATTTATTNTTSCWSSSPAAVALCRLLVELNGQSARTRARSNTSVLLVRTVLFFIVTGRARLVRCHTVLRSLTATATESNNGDGNGDGIKHSDNDQGSSVADATTAVALQRLWQDLDMALAGLIWCLQFQGRMPALENYLVAFAAFELGVFAMAVGEDYSTLSNEVLRRIAQCFETHFVKAGLVSAAAAAAHGGSGGGGGREDTDGMMAVFAKTALELASKITHNRKSAEMGAMVGVKTRGGLAQLSGQGRRL